MIDRERREFARRHARSRELHERAAGSLLAGVPMSWMTMWAGGHPIYLDSAEGARLVDVDGNEYADFCLGDTGAMAGHSPSRSCGPSASGQASPRCSRPRTPPGWARSLTRRFGLPYWQFSLTRHRRQPLAASHVPPGHAPPQGRGVQLVLPRLRRRGVRDAGRLARGQRRPDGRSHRDHARGRVQRDRLGGGGARRTATWPAC